jgi:hypothetical protein
MVEKFGKASEEGLINHVVYPLEFYSDPEAMADLLESLLEDPLLKVVVVNQAISGTAEGFNRIRQKRPDILLLAGEPQDPPALISQAATLVLAADHQSRGYLLPYVAKEMGADSFVHISFPRHMAYDHMKTREAIMRVSTKDLGLAYYTETAPDPTGEAGVDGARTFILEAMPRWLEKYGPNTAFFATNDAHVLPILQKIIEYKSGFFVEADIPSPLLAFPTAFDLDFSDYYGQWNMILTRLEMAVEKLGASGRMGVWVYPTNFSQTTGLVEFGKIMAEGRTDASNIPTLLQCLGSFSPGAKWQGRMLKDHQSGLPYDNYFLVYQDTYILGKGYIQTTKVQIPPKYFTISP